ncbi:exopolyphosphatase [Pedobacter sp. HMF7647]|uniref:Exopolyphosphatase n=1 Tax=Hufsiella arboris TaxID=2695275 RepID=A0A7K1YAD3_9SPHI|nr:exopolyphosphatase [Hufsiella arboris]MXV51537.1 exopolyphosphatase [Hufsiella arboris]
MKNRTAVIDLGTNTFNLIIAEKNEGALNELVHLEEGVKLGEGGINKGNIQEAAFLRGMQMMKHFSGLLKKYEVSNYKAIATSAIRNAKNGPDFIKQVKVQTGIVIESINGQKEAEYIYGGVKSSGALSDKTSLILDIGGGSVECILCNHSELFWKESFEIGAARLMDIFHKEDPIPSEKITELNRYLEEKLEPLFEQCKIFKPHNLIGSAGAFDTFVEMIETEKGNDVDLRELKTYLFDSIAFAEITDWLCTSSHEQRINRKSIIPLRVDMIVTASILTGFIIEKLGVKEIGMSAYSMKEGILSKLIR